MDKNKLKAKDKDFGRAEYFNIVTWSVGGISQGRQKIQEELKNRKVVMTVISWY
jgi:predicted Fe-Mo cluster-binding NifX family protein